MEIQIDDLNAPFIVFDDATQSGRILDRLERYATRHRSGVFLSRDDDGNIWAKGSGWKRLSVREDFAELAASFNEGYY